MRKKTSRIELCRLIAAFEILGSSVRETGGGEWSSLRRG